MPELIAIYAWRRRDELVTQSWPGPFLINLGNCLPCVINLSGIEPLLKILPRIYMMVISMGNLILLKNARNQCFHIFNRKLTWLIKKLYRIINLQDDITDQLQSCYVPFQELVKYWLFILLHLLTISHDLILHANLHVMPVLHLLNIAPGLLLKGKTKVHPCANKQIKSLLNMAAMASIQINGEYKTYYQRRLAEGRNKMSTLNIIRNKLVFRAFAVVKRGTPYIDLHKFAA